MKEEKLIIDHLKELTKDQIAKKTGATKVANVRFRLFIILFSVAIAAVIAIAIMSMFYPCMKQDFGATMIVVLLLILIDLYCIAKKCVNFNWSYLLTKDKEILDIHEYRQQAVHSLLFKWGHISDGKNNEYFYSALKNSIKDKIKPRLIVNYSLHLTFLGVVIALIALIINDIYGLENKLIIIFSLLYIYFIVEFLRYAYLIYDRIKNRDYYDDLNTILDSLMVKDAAKYNKTEEQIMNFIMKWMEKNTK